MYHNAALPAIPPFGGIGSRVPATYHSMTANEFGMTRINALPSG